MTKIELPEGIFEKIMSRIREEKRFMAVRRRMIIFSVCASISSVALIPSFKMVYSNFTESGFLRFFSLLFSDFGAMAGYWESFIMALLESLPAASLAVFLAAIFVLLESLKFLTKDVKLLLNNY